jgi:hypothetical protein
MDIQRLSRIKAIKLIQENAKYQIGETVQIINPDKNPDHEITRGLTFKIHKLNKNGIGYYKGKVENIYFGEIGYGFSEHELKKYKT